ncbi:hypothetical protein D3C76_763200 [compost metagenome]
MSDATDAALPPLDPPGTLDKSQGLDVFLIYELSVEDPIANSSILVFPNTIAPIDSKFSTTVAVYGGIKFSSILELHVVFTSLIQRLSFIATGTPPNTPISSPLSNLDCKSLALEYA